MKPAVVLALALTLVTAAGAAQAPPPPADTYVDPFARTLVERARARRESIDVSIASYTTVMTERIGMGIRALRRDRMMYRRELALKIRWSRDSTGTVEVVGAREAVPFALKGERMPEDLQRDVADYAFDPSTNRLNIGGDDSGFVIHPLSPDGGQHYRFESGDSTLLTFPDGRTVTLYELRIIPRRLDARLMTGALWIEADTYGVVRLLSRLARPFDFDIDISRRERAKADSTTDSVTAVRAGPRSPSDTTERDNDDEDIPFWLKPIRADVRFFTIEFLLWSDRWWLPRLIAFDGVVSVANRAEFPMRYELTYDNYEVVGDPAAVRTVRPPAITTDSARTLCEAEHGEDSTVSCRCREGRCRVFTVSVPTDTAAMLASTALPAGFRSMDDSMMSEQEFIDLGRELGDLPPVPWQTVWQPPRWGLVRYNRVEALSLGARGEVDFGRLRADGLFRIGVADVVPNVEVGVTKPGTAMRTRLSGYYRLAAADTTVRPFGLINSFNALFFRKDDGQYFRALGAELTGRPDKTRPQTWAWRVWAEQQRPVDKETDFSVPHLFDPDKDFPPNIVADTADQLGAALELRATRALGEGTASVGAEMSVDGSVGTFEFFRSSITFRATTPLPGPLTGAVEVAGGTSAGSVPVQSLWYLGGVYSLRGYDGGVSAGPSFWRARTEIGNDFPAFRIALFADAGKTGTLENLGTRHALLGVGAGISMLDGLLRIDVSRATRTPTGWRVDFYFDGVM